MWACIYFDTYKPNTSKTSSSLASPQFQQIEGGQQVSRPNCWITDVVHGTGHQDGHVGLEKMLRNSKEQVQTKDCRQWPTNFTCSAPRIKSAGLGLSNCVECMQVCTFL